MLGFTVSWAVEDWRRGKTDGAGEFRAATSAFPTGGMHDINSLLLEDQR